MAIQDPKTFNEAVATATRLESLDKTKPGKVTFNLIGVESESETESLEGPAGIVDRLGMVLARIEAAPWNQNPNRQKEQNRQGQKGYTHAEGSKKGGQQGGKADETTKTRDQTFRNTEKGFDQNKKKGTMFKKTPFNPKKFCIAHQNYGHATDNCSWLKGRLKELPPPPIYTGKGKGDKEVSRETNRAARPLKGDYSLLGGWAGAKGDRGRRCVFRVRDAGVQSQGSGRYRSK